MNEENRLKTLAGLSGLWGGSPISRFRAGDGITQYFGRRVSLHIQIQPLAAGSILNDPVVRDQGFLSRCLICEPASAIGSRTRVGHSPESDIALKDFRDAIARNLRVP